MIQYQRHREILARLEASGAMSVRRLARELFTSESTIRRDLGVLEQQGVVRRVYGGVVLATRTGVDMPAFHREQDHAAQKEAIAARAATLIEDGMSIFLDAATTTTHLLPHFEMHKNITVITNSLLLTERLGELGESRVRVYCTGGLFLPHNHAFGGAAAVRMISSMRADLMFFSSRGLSENGEITDTAESETEVRCAMLARSRRRIFLCHADKVGREYVFRLCGQGDYEGIVCNGALPDGLRELQI